MIEHVHYAAGHQPDLYALYGFAFLLLGVVLLAAPKDQTLPGALADRHLLAAFGLAHGCVGLWSGWVLLHAVDAGWARWLTSSALLVSYLPLVEMVRRRLAARLPRLCGPWSWLPLGAGVAGLALYSADPAAGLGTAARMLLAFPGALGTGVALMGSARRGVRLTSYTATAALGVAAACFVLYGVLAGLFQSAPPALPFLPTERAFYDTLGVAIQVPRMLLGVVLAVCFWTVLESLRHAAEPRRLQALELAESSAQRLEEEVRRRTKELHATEGRLQRAQRVARAGSWHEDLRSREQWYSDETYRMLGMEPACGTVVERFLALVHPDDAARLDAAWRAALKEGEFDLEFRVVVHGVQKWLRARAEFERDETGRALEAIGTAQDITGRKEAELRQREGQLLLRTVIDATPDWIFVKDLDHRFLVVNRAFAAAQELLPRDMVGRTDTDFWSPELCEGDPDRGHSGFHNDDRTAFSGTVVHNPQDVATLADGSERIFDTVKTPLRDGEGNIYGVLAYARDITARHQDSERLRASMEQIRDAERRQRELAALAREEQGRMSALLSVMSIGILFEDRDRRVAYVNPAFLAMWGIDPDTEPVGESTHLLLERSAHRFVRADGA